MATPPWARRGDESQKGEEEDADVDGKERDVLATRTIPRGTAPLGDLLDNTDDLVNADVPSHYLQVYRHHGIGLKDVKPRCKDSLQKLDYRLGEGPPLAHNNWDKPSKVRITTGISKGRRLEQPANMIRPTKTHVKLAVFSSLETMHLFEDRTVRILDLFAGQGTLGLEALSRGATECIFVDSSRECVDCCLANAWLSGFMSKEDAAKGPLNDQVELETKPIMMVGGPRAQVAIERHRMVVESAPVGALHVDVFDLLEDPAKYGLGDRTFNCVLVGPSYNEVSYRKLCTALAKSDLIERDGFVCIDYPRELGVLPPILYAPFEDPENEQEACQGIPILQGVRNRKYGNCIMAIYMKLPTGARGQTCEPRPHEFVETNIPRKMRKRVRSLWRTPTLFKNSGNPEFARPKPKPYLPPME